MNIPNEYITKTEDVADQVNRPSSYSHQFNMKIHAEIPYSHTCLTIIKMVHVSSELYQLVAALLSTSPQTMKQISRFL